MGPSPGKSSMYVSPPLNISPRPSKEVELVRASEIKKQQDFLNHKLDKD